ncbi:MAG: hypothetical protein A2046_11695 [Bacteroidetes bacterium GWA2_30_7]|nr:MAG: hypothetical protein A2046_11695 [Bacteroidetes bacterium GWA2_30_7]
MKLLTILFYIQIITYCSVFSQESTRKELIFPDIFGLKTIKCDFHSHTVFSDGLVWPTVRIKEAWADGLDLICITDHLEYRPHEDDVKGDFNKSWEIAKKEADKLNILCIKGCEITKRLPPGHFNAVFTKDNNKILKDDFYESVNEAYNQGAFITWNHPGWLQPNSIPVWYEQQSTVMHNKQMQGIEVVNDKYYAPLAFQWAIDSNLTLICGSDLHNPSNMDYKCENNSHRPLTLVFAKEKTEESVKEALLKRQTVIWHENLLLGNEKYLNELFENSLKISYDTATYYGNKTAVVKIENQSSFDFEIVPLEVETGLNLNSIGTLYGNSTNIIKAKYKGKFEITKLELPIIIKNLLIAPEIPLKTVIIL